MARPSNSGKPVVTLFEQYGCGADDIGRKVAAGLAVTYHGQAFSSEELEAAAEQREKESLLSRVFTAMGGSYGSSFGGFDVGDVTSGQRDKYNVVLENNTLLREWADQGGVIVGHNAALVLADWPASLHVLLIGSDEQRIARAAEGSGISVDRARKRQKREDQVRAEMSLDLYGWDPRRPEGYHLTVNTDIGLDACAQIIVAAYRAKATAGGDPNRAEG
ncbi:cytidylate kinase-like family protein [Mycolicibacterium thermoresistibile]